ncbi:MAG: methyltransferase domain-containing protein [Candidatus Binatia bacterium]|nr:methyltransferase domain-containing protein [Candidatus Binatia bacterium]
MRSCRLFVLVLLHVPWLSVACTPPLPVGTPPLDVPYIPTPLGVVKRMLQLAGVGPTDVVYDLGAGDGRIVITAARRFGARAVGVELDPLRVAEATANARRAGVSERVRFLQQDLLLTDLREATVVTLFLTPALNLRLRPKLWRELRPGARVVSHLYDMGDWKPDRVERVQGRPVYRWTIPARNTH